MTAKSRALSQRLIAFGCLLLAAFGCSPSSPSGGGTGGGATLGGTSGGGGTNDTSGGAFAGGAVGGAVTSGGASSGGGATGTGGAGTGAASAGGGLTGGSTAGGSAGAGGASGGALPSGGSGGGLGGNDDWEVNATAMVADMGFGTNIGNTLENTTDWETGWGQPVISEAFINGIASRGIKTVRVPVAWDTYAENGVIDPAKMSRVQEVVAMIRAAEMYAIVNIHWDGGWIFNEGLPGEYTLTDGVKTKFASYWQQIADAFADVGHRLIFEGLNEEARYYVGGDPNGQPDYPALNEINQLFVSTVRQGEGFNQTRALLVAGFNTDIARTCVDDFVVPTDPAGANKLFLSLHYYTPYTFCGLDTVESWGSPQTTWGSDAERAELTGLFDQAAAFGIARGLPIILGEFAVTPGENYVRESASRTLWMRSVAEACLSRGMVPVLWDTGSEVSRADGAFSADFAPVMEAILSP